MLAALCAGLVVLAAPAPVRAGTAEVRKITVKDPFGRSEVTNALFYVADRGERNNLTLREVGEEVQVRDVAGVATGSGCRRENGGDSTSAICSPALDEYTLDGRQGIVVALGDLNDAAVVEKGRAGADGAVPQGVGADLRGGDGEDALREVVSRQLGETSVTRFEGGMWDDRMMGVGTFDEGSRANGSDAMLGGGTVSYVRRSAAVRADLSGDADDGERGEGDRVGGATNNLVGGHGPDVLTGDAFPNEIAGGPGGDVIRGGGGADELDAGSHVARRQTRGAARPDIVRGGRGDDRISGSAGNDRLTGGSGRDELRAGAGDDLIRSRDGTNDRITCSAGRDLAVLDGVDFFRRRGGDVCERVRRNRPAAAMLSPDLAENPRLLFIYGGGDDYLEVGCPADAPKVCRGRARVTWRGRTLLAGRVRVRRNRIGLVDIRLTRVGRRVLRTRLVGVSIRVETRDRSGRLQVRRTKAAIEEGEVDNGPDN